MNGASPRHSVEFDDNRLLPLLYGEHDTHLARIEHHLGVTLASRGNVLTIAGPDAAAETARAALQALWQRLKAGEPVGNAEVDAAVRLAAGGGVPSVAVRTRRKQIQPRSPTQAAYLQALQQHPLVFGIGPAGTGKTYLAVAQAVSMLITGEVKRLILSRPAVEAGERLGFLPGDLKDKIDPYLRPLYDALHDMMPNEQVAKRMESGDIEIAPLAFMRGRTLSNAYVILDEAQNTTAMQMKMFLTRLGEGSRMVVTGDVSQIDLPRGVTSGLVEALDVLRDVEGIGVVRFNEGDVVRHDMVARIVKAYDKHDRSRQP